jgi:serine/threonine protein kinase
MISRSKTPVRSATMISPAMSVTDDMQFLALLVHRGELEREQAEGLVAQLKRESVALDSLLVDQIGWSAERVARLRRTRAGEVPEIPGYEIQGHLGRGGTADVFRAREKKSGRTLALKVLNPASTRSVPILNAFLREAKLLVELDHPGLVKGYGPAKYAAPGEREVYFSRLECIEGSTLLELLDQGQAFTEEVALRIVLTVAETLSALAAKDLVHRDVKPGNLMLDHNGRVKLIDLGFAALRNEQTSPSGTATGTKEYLSPEQALGGAAADTRSDIYSLGVTLFHLVVGRLPFESSDDREVLRMQVMQSLSSPELKGRALSPHLHYFVEKMMAKEADVRYQSWQELIDDVKAQLEGRESLDFSKGDAEPAPRVPRRRRKF